VLLDAFLRGVFAALLLGVALGLTIPWYRWQGIQFGSDALRAAVISGASCSLALGPVAIVEGLARRFAPSAGRMVVTFAVAFAVAYGVDRLAPVAQRYVEAVCENPLDLTQSLAAMLKPKIELVPSDPYERWLSLAWCAELALLVALRLGGLSLAAQSILATTPAAADLLWGREHAFHVRPHWLLPGLTYVVVGGAFLPLVAEMARRISDRAFTSMTFEERQPDSTVVIRGSRRRGALLVYLAVLALELGVLAREYAKEAGHFIRRPSTSEQALLDRWKAWADAKGSASEVAALISASSSETLEVRERVGEDDPLRVVVRVRAVTSPDDGAALSATAKLRLDGELREAEFPFIFHTPLGAAPGLNVCEGACTLLPASPGRGVPGFRLGVGMHKISVVTTASVIARPAWAPVWSGSFSLEKKFEVLPGSLRSEIALVTPLGFDPNWFLYGASIVRPRASRSQLLDVNVEAIELPVYSRISVFDGDRLLVGDEALMRDADDWKLKEEFILRKDSPLAPGRHVLRVVVTPDPHLVLEQSATVREILGASFERTFEVDVK
jgi:hypothetical protein